MYKKNLSQNMLLLFVVDIKQRTKKKIFQISSYKNILFNYIFGTKRYCDIEVRKIKWKHMRSIRVH